MSLNRQAVFETALTGMLKQKAFSRTHDDHCLYRSDDGLKCAIGFCIPDENIPTIMNDYGDLQEVAADDIMHLLDDKFGKASIDNDSRFLVRLQEMLHDNHSSEPFDRDTVLRHARIVADEYKLEMPDVT